MDARPPLFTIGYEQARQPALLAALKQAGVSLVADVRAIAASRRPGFSKRQLAAGLDEEGIAYLHLRRLGTPAAGRLAARQGRHEEMRRIFAEQLATEPAQEELSELAALVGSGRPVCLLCFERDPHHCHRLMVAERVSAITGARLEHLFSIPEI